MENGNKKTEVPWWQPAMLIFVRLSGWIVGPVILGVLIGKWLDEKFKTEPWLFLLSVACAFAVSIIMIIRIGLKEMDKK